LGKFVEILIQETEKVRVCLVQTRKRIAISEKNFLFEEKLRVLVENFNLYDENEYLDLIGSICDRNFELKI
jgi:hypothetical protein